MHAFLRAPDAGAVLCQRLDRLNRQLAELEDLRMHVLEAERTAVSGSQSRSGTPQVGPVAEPPQGTSSVHSGPSQRVVSNPSAIHQDSEARKNRPARFTQVAV